MGLWCLVELGDGAARVQLNRCEAPEGRGRVEAVVVVQPVGKKYRQPARKRTLRRSGGVVRLLLTDGDHVGSTPGQLIGQ